MQCHVARADFYVWYVFITTDAQALFMVQRDLYGSQHWPGCPECYCALVSR